MLYATGWISDEHSAKAANTKVKDALRAVTADTCTSLRAQFESHYDIDVKAHRLTRCTYVARTLERDDIHEHRREPLQGYLHHNSDKASRHYDLLQHILRDTFVDSPDKTDEEKTAELQQLVARRKAKEAEKQTLEGNISKAQGNTDLDDDEKKILIAGLRKMLATQERDVGCSDWVNTRCQKQSLIDLTLGFLSSFFRRCIARGSLLQGLQLSEQHLQHADEEQQEESAEAALPSR